MTDERERLSPQEIVEYAVWYARKVRGPQMLTAAALLEEYPWLREPLEEADRGTVTDCPLDGVHEHVFRGPHGFREWVETP